MTAAEHEAAITRLLAELGDTPDAVADSLRAKGIKGKRNKVQCCPVANYIRSNAQGLSFVCVVRRTVGFMAEDQAISTRQWTATTNAVETFTRRFDEGVYLDLEEVDG